MEKVYFTITGTCYYFGNEFMEPGMKVRIVKEPDNEFDREAIRADMDGLGKVGYVANSPRTVQGESMSAGRIYDRIGDTANGVIKYVLPKGVLCVLSNEAEGTERIEEAPECAGESEASERVDEIISGNDEVLE